MKINNTNRLIILAELMLPMVLLILGVYHGFVQTLYRAGFIQASEFLGIGYYQGLTLHGVINAIVLTTFFAVAFGNAVVNFHLNKKINVTINVISFALMVAGTLMAAWAMLSGKASVLYTFYPPLKAHPLFYFGVVFLVIGSWIAFFNWFPLYKKWKRENPDKKVPLAVIGTFATFIIWVISTIPVAVEIIFYLIPWSMGWVQDINILLCRVLFWFFGHPLVYFWLLPVYVMFYTILPKVAGGKLYSDFAGRLVFMLFIIFSIPVGLHHQFAEPGISQGLKLLHAFLTFGVALPSLITAFTVSASLEYSGIQNGSTGLLGWLKKQPYFQKDKFMFPYLMCGLFIFLMGGITGIVNASYGMNMVVHNTSFLPGHFHLTVGGPVFLGILGMSLYLYSVMTGKEIKWKGWNVAIPYLWTIGLFFFSTGLMVGGIMGEPRRTNMGLTYLNPDSELFRPMWVITTFMTAIGGLILFATMIIYFIIFFKTAFGKQVHEAKIEMPVAEAYHDEKKIGFVKNFTPWVVIAVIIIAFAYYFPIQEAIKNNQENAKPYNPDNPMPIEMKEKKNK